MPIAFPLPARPRDLGGGFNVRRLLPAAKKQSVGPFVFFDHFGPIVTRPGDNHDVRPHPHIGLATVTYLFEGAMLHRDSLGSVQRIEPGAINWMTAGRGIVHSERTPPDLRDTSPTPRMDCSSGRRCRCAFEETEPVVLAHAGRRDSRVFEAAACASRVLIGDAFGLRSPVATFAPTLYVDVEAQAGASLDLPPARGTAKLERAVYSVDHPVTIDGETSRRSRWPCWPKAARRSSRRTARASSSSAASRSTGRASSGGTSWRRTGTASNAQSSIGRSSGWGTIPGEHEWIPLPQ